eukprot:67532-Amphidinium_carterae.1
MVDPDVDSGYCHTSIVLMMTKWSKHFTALAKALLPGDLCATTTMREGAVGCCLCPPPGA